MPLLVSLHLTHHSRTIVRSPLVRRQTGYDLDLDGFETDHISLGDTILFRNPYIGLRLHDEEIAISTMLTAMAAWCRDEGPAPHPLADGCQNHLVALAIEESVSSGAPVTTAAEAWADSTL
ncbi:MAG TPA: hypothetical protein VIK06_04765 [Candidatus Limnocylindrales bacterium]